MDDKMKALMVSVRENLKTLAACPRHRFETDDFEPGKLGQTMPCRVCGGNMRFSPDIGRYIEGYEAAGGDANDIWPGYRTQRDGG